MSETIKPDAPPLRDSAPRALWALNTGAVVVAALYFGQELLVPLVLAGLLAFVLAPIVRLLQRGRLPRVAAVLLAVAIAFGMIGLLGVVVWHQAALLAAHMQEYERAITAKLARLAAHQGVIGTLARSIDPATGADGGGAMAGASTAVLARRFAQPLLGPLGTAGVALLFTLFILLNTEDLRDRFVRLVGRQGLHRTISALNDAGRRLSRYFLSQLTINALFGVWIAAALWFAGIPGALLWGVLAMLMRFVPFLGTFVSLTPPLVIAAAATPGWGSVVIVAVLFLGSEAIMGQVIEPLVYGHNTGVSPLAIIVATSFWALIWGFVGLLIATPLTVCLVVMGRHVESLSFFDVMFGDASPLLPSETFYQRALEGRAAALHPAARAHIAASSSADYYDNVALPGLIFAQRDRARDALAFERLEAVHAQVDAFLHALPLPAPHEAVDVPAAWRADGAILCLPGRGHLDDLAAAMAVRVLQEAGFGARLAPNAILDSSDDTALDPERVQLCCLSVLEDSATDTSIRLFVRRMQRRLPGAAITVGLWHAAGDSPMLAALRAKGDQEHLVLSIGELLAYARAIASAQSEPPPAVPDPTVPDPGMPNPGAPLQEEPSHA